MYLLFNAVVAIGTVVTLGLIAAMLHQRSGAIVATLLQGSTVRATERVSSGSARSAMGSAAARPAFA